MHQTHEVWSGHETSSLCWSHKGNKFPPPQCENEYGCGLIHRNLFSIILCFSEQLSREQEAQAMGVGLKYSDNNRLWLTVYIRSFVSCPILSAFKGLCLSSLDNCSENYNNF